MSRKCEICGKGQVSGNNVSHSNRHTRRKWDANIQTVRANVDGTVKRVHVCTSCIRSGKVDRNLNVTKKEAPVVAEVEVAEVIAETPEVVVEAPVVDVVADATEATVEA